MSVTEPIAPVPAPVPPTAPDPAPDAGPVAGAAPAGYRTNLITALLGFWFTIGLFLDAWAHNNVPRLETFFTPWHAVFYSGFAVTAAWILWTARGALLPGGGGLRAVPAAYVPAGIAVVGFAIAGVGDLSWHTVFGIEQNIDILFSPTHLGLVTAMTVIITTPLRSAWADPTLPVDPGLRRLLPALLSTALAGTLVLLFLQYANALVFDQVRIVVGLSALDESFTADLVTSMAVTNVVLLLPLLALARRWVLPFGTATLVYAAAGGLSAAVAGFDNARMIGALLVAGVCVDLLARWLRPTADRPLRYRAFAILTPLVTWSIYVATAFALSPPLHSPPEVAGGHPEAVVELYTGAPLVQALFGLLIAVVLVPSRSVPARA